jgi:hypothetical protein
MNMTAMNWFVEQLPIRIINMCHKEIEQAKQMEIKKTIMDYNAGYDDAQCNHINDAENYANEQKYLNT